MDTLRRSLLSLPSLAFLLKGAAAGAENEGDSSRSITVWHGDTQRVGHLGDAQDDFNVMGRVGDWRNLDLLSYRVNKVAPTPLAFRAYRRLAEDGTFNADVPIGRLNAGENTITIDAVYRDGQQLRKEITVRRELGSQSLPLKIRWSELKHFQGAGQAVDGHWELTPKGLRTKQVGYDRVFLVGERGWRDYQVRTSVTINAVPHETSPLSGGNGLGIILRFAGHINGGHRFFPSGQPKWGYQPFGSIGWLRWARGKNPEGPNTQFYPGDGDRSQDKQLVPIKIGATYGMVYACTTMPDAPDGRGVTRYRYKVWPVNEEEPAGWTWEHIQTSAHALRNGGFVLLAHHIDATFGDVDVTLPVDVG